MNLYSIDTSIQLLQEQYLNEDLSDAERELVAQELERVIGEQSNKYENIVNLRANKLWEVEAIQNEIDRLNKKLKPTKNLVNTLEDMLESSLLLAWIDRMGVWTFNLSFRKSESVEITDETLLPVDYVVTKTTTAPDKTWIKKAIREWINVPWAVIKENLNLQIK